MGSVRSGGLYLSCSMKARYKSIPKVNPGERSAGAAWHGSGQVHSTNSQIQATRLRATFDSSFWSLRHRTRTKLNLAQRLFASTRTNNFSGASFIAEYCSLTSVPGPVTRVTFRNFNVMPSMKNYERKTRASPSNAPVSTSAPGKSFPNTYALYAFSLASQVMTSNPSKSPTGPCE